MRKVTLLMILVFFAALMALSTAAPAWAQTPAAVQTPTPGPNPTASPTPTPPGAGSGSGSSGGRGSGDEGIEMGEALGRWVQQVAVGVGVGTAYLLSNYAWFFTRFVVAVYTMLTQGDWAATIVEQALNNLQATMPQVIQTILIGQNGLLYLALGIAGLMMVFPFLARRNPVRIDRVFIWAVLILVLFSGSEISGYNLIALFEHTRQQVFLATLGNDTSGAMRDLALEPWRATGAEAQLDLSFRLPEAFQREFFPEPQTENVTVNLARQWWQATWTLETPDSLARRRLGALQGVIWAGVGVYGAIVLGITSFVFVLLALASLVLIVLFLATLPLAVFTFGEALVLRVVSRWFGVFALSIFVAVFLRVTSAWVSGLSLAGGEIGTLVGWFVWLTLLLLSFLQLSRTAMEMFAGALLLSKAIVSAPTGAVPDVPRGATRQLGQGMVTGGKVLSGTAVVLGRAATAGAVLPAGAVGVATATAIQTGVNLAGRAAGKVRSLRGRENVFMATGVRT